jgi:hypothetical protein
MKHFVFQILDVASVLGREASNANPAGALAHLGEPHPDPTHSDRRPTPWTQSRRPSTPASQAVQVAVPVPGRPESPVRALGGRAVDGWCRRNDCDSPGREDAQRAACSGSRSALGSERVRTRVCDRGDALVRGAAELGG